MTRPCNNCENPTCPPACQRYWDWFNSDDSAPKNRDSEKILKELQENLELMESGMDNE